MWLNQWREISAGAIAGYEKSEFGGSIVRCTTWLLLAQRDDDQIPGKLGTAGSGIGWATLTAA